MHVELSQSAKAIVDQQIASGDFDTPDDVVEQAIGFFAVHGPGSLVCIDPQTGEEISPITLAAIIQEGLDDESAGRIRPLDVADIKQRGRDRLAGRTRSQ